MREEIQVELPACGNCHGWNNIDPSTVVHSSGCSWHKAGILEFLPGLEGTSKGHLIQNLFDGQGHLPEDLAAFPSLCKHWGVFLLGNLSKSWFSNLWGQRKGVQGTFPIPCSHFGC